MKLSLPFFLFSTAMVAVDGSPRTLRGLLGASDRHLEPADDGETESDSVVPFEIEDEYGGVTETKCAELNPVYCGASIKGGGSKVADKCPTTCEYSGEGALVYVEYGEEDENGEKDKKVMMNYGQEIYLAKPRGLEPHTTCVIDELEDNKPSRYLVASSEGENSADFVWGIQRILAMIECNDDFYAVILQVKELVHENRDGVYKHPDECFKNPLETEDYDGCDLTEDESERMLDWWYFIQMLDCGSDLSDAKNITICSTRKTFYDMDLATVHQGNGLSGNGVGVNLEYSVPSGDGIGSSGDGSSSGGSSGDGSSSGGSSGGGSSHFENMKSAVKNVNTGITKAFNNLFSF